MYFLKHLGETKAKFCLVSLVLLAHFFSGPFLLIDAAQAKAGTRPSPVILIPAGSITPLFGMDPDQKTVSIPSFKIDPTLVTHEQFFRFLKKNPAWFPSQVSPLFADQKYLKNWNYQKPPRALTSKAITYVSWFAANAYCESKGGRLPSVLEWEYVAAADEIKRNATLDPAFSSKLLRWYEKPTQAGHLLKLKTKKPNFYGLYDLHELVWEWTSDFNSVFVSGDNRQDGDKMKNFVCGAGSTNSTTKEDYAAFLRYAMRSALRPEYAQHNLGFRCAYNALENFNPSTPSKK